MNHSVNEIATKAQETYRILSQATRLQKDQALAEMALALENNLERILEANDSDCRRAKESGVKPSMLNRLVIDEGNILSRIKSLQTIQALDDPVGQVIHADSRPNGLQVRRVRVPLGVILMIYEARPHVTVNAGAFCLKSGNAAILRGGSEARECNTLLGSLWKSSLEKAGLPSDAVQVITSGHDEISELLSYHELINLVIPRGSKTMVETISSSSRIPVLKHSDGVCHIYIDKTADPQKAIDIAIDSKCLMPEVCNAAETILIHKDWEYKIQLLEALHGQGVGIRGCPSIMPLHSDATAATDSDWSAEYLDLILSIKQVTSMQDAMNHITNHGSGHTDVIITQDVSSAREFQAHVDSSVVLVNASTMFCDGYSLGMGAEIGISTNKLHARGPMGLQELTSYKFLITGNGHTYTENPCP